MKVLSFIEDEEIIKKILKHLGLWEINPPSFWWVKARPPPRVTGPPKIQEYKIDYSTSQVPVFTRRPVGGSDKWLYVDQEPACAQRARKYPEVYAPGGSHRLIFHIGLRLIGPTPPRGGNAVGGL